MPHYNRDHGGPRRHGRWARIRNKFIEEWIRRGNRTSPKTNLALPSLVISCPHGLGVALQIWMVHKSDQAARSSMQRASFQNGQPAEAICTAELGSCRGEKDKLVQKQKDKDSLLT